MGYQVCYNAYFSSGRLSSCDRFAFQPWHNASEFRRHLRYIHHFADLHTLSPFDCTPYELLYSIVTPITTYLQGQGVDFKYNIQVKDILMGQQCDQNTVSALKIRQCGTENLITIDDNDIVILTLGSLSSGSQLGTNTTPPRATSETTELALDDSWDLWINLAEKNPKLGDPMTFCSRISESIIACFLVTLTKPAFFEYFSKLVGSTASTSTLLGFKDSNWRLSINVPRQPHFPDQPQNIQVFWGYALSPESEGNFIKKPMSNCTGEEVMSEILHHLEFPLDAILECSTTTPSLVPLATSPYLTRNEGDRPEVVPHGITNMGLIGNFVEIPDDTVLSMEYSVRGAQEAVYQLMGLGKKPRTHKSYWDSIWTILL